MKNTNNITLIVFIIIVVGVISTATFFIYRNNTKKEANQTNSVQENNVAIVDNLKMGIAEYDTINPILTKNKEISNNIKTRNKVARWNNINNSRCRIHNQ